MHGSGINASTHSYGHSRLPFVFLASLAIAGVLMALASLGLFHVAPETWFPLAAILVLQGYFALTPDAGATGG